MSVPLLPAPGLVHVYDAQVDLAAEVLHGPTPLGGRSRAPITGGWFRGPRMSGRVVPGGSDWQLLRRDGWLQIDAEYYLRTDDGVDIHLRNRGLWHSPTGDWPADYALAAPVFEAPLGPYEWLNQRLFSCLIGPGPGPEPAVTLSVYELVPSTQPPKGQVE